MQQIEKQPKPYDEWSPARVFSKASQWAAILLGLFFTEGYLYWFLFYNRFNIEVQALDLPASTIWTGLFWELGELSRPLIGLIDQNPLWCTVLACLTTIVSLVGVSSLSRLKRHEVASAPKVANTSNLLKRLQLIGDIVEALEPWAKWLICAMLLLLIPLILSTRRALIVRSNPLYKAHLFFKSGEEKLYGTELEDANRKGRLALLTQTKDLIVVYLVGHSDAHLIPRANLQEIRVEPAM